VGKANFIKIECNEKKKSFYGELKWMDSAEAEEHLIELGPSKAPVCWILCGYISGYVSFCMDKEIYFVEEKCRAKNDKICFATGRDIDSWDNAIEPYIEFFKGENILAKVKELTSELKAKDKKLLAQKKKLESITPKLAAEYIEIRSEAYRKVFEAAARVAQFDTYVLISGESGTGKEVLARFIHRSSNRASKPFVAINCGALPETLLEGELFGYKAGAFTGASKGKKGLFEEANGGVIFLDEIGDISPGMQVKLLRVLQEQEVLRLGENVPRKINARVIAATNRNLQHEVAEGIFRGDLYYRLAVVEIEIPPLRKRIEDIPPLVRHFVKKLSKKLNIPKLHIDSTCIEYLTSYNWPGNIRELENTIERAAVFSKEGGITPTSLPQKVINYNPQSTSTGDLGCISLAEMERRHILATLEKNSGNKTKTAEDLGVSPVTLWRKLSRINAGKT
jgi:transcriptional regulator with PAS, ATPase and Fis domain